MSFTKNIMRSHSSLSSFKEFSQEVEARINDTHTEEENISNIIMVVGIALMALIGLCANFYNPQISDEQKQIQVLEKQIQLLELKQNN